MGNNLFFYKIKELTKNLLICADNFLIMKKSVDQIYSIFSEITGITADNFNNEQIILPSGKAISPSSAAHCLLEFRRSAIFLRGINKAIQQKLMEPNQDTIRILYAGTGPYATLIIPLLTTHSSNNVKVDFLDINEISLKASLKILDSLGLNGFIDQSYLCDAATFKIEKEYDLVISETMQAALKKEPQVAIMQNLIPQMTSHSIFIPEAITVNAALVSNGHWDGEKGVHSGVITNHLGDLLTIGKQYYNLKGYRKKVDLSGTNGNYNKLMLYTTIRVFENEILKDSDCSLTLPLRVCELDENQTGTIVFWYEQGELPGFRCQIEGSAQIFEAIGGRQKFSSSNHTNRY